MVAIAGIATALVKADNYITAKIETATLPYRKLLAVTAAFHDARAEEAMGAMHELFKSDAFKSLPPEAQTALCDDLLFAIVNSRELTPDSRSDMLLLQGLIGGLNPNTGKPNIVETPWRGFQFAFYKLRTGEFEDADNRFSKLTLDFRRLKDTTTAALCIRNRIYVALCRSQPADVVDARTEELLKLENTDYDCATLLHDVERLPRIEWWRDLENGDSQLADRQTKLCNDLRGRLGKPPTVAVDHN